VSDVIRSLSYAVVQAVTKDLPDVVHGSDEKGWKSRRPYEQEVEVYHFPQTWSSTALGFGGVGGQAFTTAYTTVVIHVRDAAVYFNGGYAYLIADFNEHLMEDIRDQNVAARGHSGKYKSKQEG
jgi:hypothetical protein